MPENSNNQRRNPNKRNGARFARPEKKRELSAQELLIEAQNELNRAWESASSTRLASQEFGAGADNSMKNAEPAVSKQAKAPGSNPQNVTSAEKPAQNNRRNNQKKPETSQKNDQKAQRQNQQRGEGRKPGRPPKNQAHNVPQPTMAELISSESTSGKRDKLRIIPLGGLREVGKNITLYEYGNDTIVVDCGMGFPEDDMLGIDLVIPDMTYLVKQKSKVRGVLITHGHEDHIGSLAYLLREFNPPIYATPFARGLIESKLEEAGLLKAAKIITINPGELVTLGCFAVEAIAVNHSTPDSVAFAINTPLGPVIHTGDFKIDSTPVGGSMIDLARFGEYGRKGVLALLSDSTNVERPGYTMSERTVGETFDNLFRGSNQRLIITTFASNAHRIQQIIEAAVKVGRKVAINGRSMEKVMGLASKLGYVNLPQGTMVDINQINSIPKNKLVIVTTGSQGETLSALYRMAFGTHRQVEIGEGDRVIMSASPIPGNENSISKVINELFKRGADVVYERLNALHVSGHACQEELKIMLGLTKPKYFMPVHGEYKMLRAHGVLAERMGIAKKNIFISENGRVLEFTQTGAKLAGNVTAGQVLIDGGIAGDAGGVVLRDRKHLAEDGVVVVTFTFDKNGKLSAGPEIVTRGFIFVKDSENLVDKLNGVAMTAISAVAGRGRAVAASAVKDAVSDYIYRTTRRRPMVLTVGME